MDEEPGAVIHRLLEDGDVEIIDPPPPPSPLSANVVISFVLGRNPYQIFNPPPIAFGRIPKLSPICCRNPKPVKAIGYQIFAFAACLRANSETLADVPQNPDIKSSPLLLAFGRAPKLSPICCRNPKPVHLGFAKF